MKLKNTILSVFLTVMLATMLGGCEGDTGTPKANTEQDSSISSNAEVSEVTPASEMGSVSGDTEVPSNTADSDAEVIEQNDNPPIAATKPNCPAGQSMSGSCEEHDATKECKNEDGEVVRVLQCRQWTCWCSGPNTARHGVNGPKDCSGSCPRNSSLTSPGSVIAE